jgi:hypothetical protein
MREEFRSQESGIRNYSEFWLPIPDFWDLSRWE